MTIIYLDGTPEELAEFHRLVKEDDDSHKKKQLSNLLRTGASQLLDIVNKKVPHNSYIFFHSNALLVYISAAIP